jgi:predicted O-linked N-acetylglucosamine transferase (SPINDLY family)
LLLYARAERHRERAREVMDRAGVSESRLTFVGRQPFEDYLQTYSQIDVGLDPVPFGGGTTTCDALWMGVPVISLAGKTAVSRGGASLLSNIGLGQLIAGSEAQYLDLAADLICDADRLAALRRDLRTRLESSSVMNAHRFSRGLEAAFRDMWQTWCETRTEPPDR